MKYYRQEMVAQRKTDRVICNMCAKEISKEGADIFHDYIEIEKSWSYLSDFDGQRHHFDLCQECYKKLISSLSIMPDIED